MRRIIALGLIPLTFVLVILFLLVDMAEQGERIKAVEEETRETDKCVKALEERLKFFGRDNIK